MVKTDWIRRRWLDFRTGNGEYLRYIFAFSNTIIIAYYFLVEQVYFFDNLFSTIEIFVLVFLAGYVPIAILVGTWHIKSQAHTEVATTMYQRPLFAKSLLTILRMAQNKTSEKEIKEMREFLKQVEKGKNPNM